MKRLVLLGCALVFGACGSTSSDTASRPRADSKPLPFTGLWLVPESEQTSFELDLKQVGNRIEGYHAMLVLPSGRIEVALPSDGEPPSVTGELLSKYKARVHYKLRRKAGEGDAVLTLRGGRMTWELVGSSGDKCLPQECPLVRQKAH